MKDASKHNFFHVCRRSAMFDLKLYLKMARVDRKFNHTELQFLSWPVALWSAQLCYSTEQSKLGEQFLLQWSGYKKEASKRHVAVACFFCPENSLHLEGWSPASLSSVSQQNLGCFSFNLGFQVLPQTGHQLSFSLYFFLSFSFFLLLFPPKFSFREV